MNYRRGGERLSSSKIFFPDIERDISLLPSCLWLVNRLILLETTE
jgi:hypothetical protein